MDPLYELNLQLWDRGGDDLGEAQVRRNHHIISFNPAMRWKPGAELAGLIDVPVNRNTAILNGQQGISPDTALRLGHWFGTARSSGSTHNRCTRFADPASNPVTKVATARLSVRALQM